MWTLSKAQGKALWPQYVTTKSENVVIIGMYMKEIVANYIAFAPCYICTEQQLLWFKHNIYQYRFSCKY